MSPAVHLVQKAGDARGNSKVGPIPVSTTNRASCPDTCPLQGNGCYAEGGPIGMWWRGLDVGFVDRGSAGRVSVGISWPTFCARVSDFPAGELWRHNQAGDLPHTDGTIDRDLVGQLIDASKHSRGFTFTHHDVEGNSQNRETVREANATPGLTVNLSANSAAHADKLLALGIGPVATVLPTTVDGEETKSVMSPAGNRIVVCPATYLHGVSCANCQLCERRDRKVIVGFPAHGSNRFNASKVAA